LSGNEIDTTEIATWDPAFTKRVITVMTPVANRRFRAEVRGWESFPPAGGALVVSNHSGGVLPPEWNILAPAFYGRFGYHRPLYTLAHYGVFITPFAGSLGGARTIGPI
jgi:1-acyl-sn-glycerol-3-phosphate acyltransferase